MNNALVACHAISLSTFSNEDLAALNLAVHGYGRVDVMNRSYKSALALNMIRVDGTPIELEELQEACVYEVNQRMQAGTFN